jgi:hypothetical protein
MCSASSHLYSILAQSLAKPLKVDVRNVCEHNLAGPITRTFELSRKDLVEILRRADTVVDRIDLTEYPNETHATLYNVSQMDNACIPAIRDVSTQTHVWDLELQYANRLAREEG